MGMYDSVMVKCPKCGEEVEFQSKAGACLLHTYTPEDAPMRILGDIEQGYEKCKCGHFVRVKVKRDFVIE